MIGIVVVSHSRPLARAAVALAEEMTHGKALRIAVAAGLDDRTFGTDAVQIIDAIRAAEDGDGVVVLMDLGSAVLSAELALDLLDDDERARVILCPAPLVEGLVVAAVAAAGGAKRHEVAAEASASLAGKQSHLAATPQPASDGASAVPVATAVGGVVGVFSVTNPHGLHARPAARLVQEVRTLDATVILRNLTTGAGPVPASSLSKVATLGALVGHEVEVSASGSQAREALEHVLALARRNFDEGATSAPRPSAAEVVSAPTSAIPASPGIGIGPSWSPRPTTIEVADTRSDDPTAEWRRLREALAAVRREVQQVRARAARDVGEAEAAIFDAHLLLLEDSDLLGDVRSRLEAGQAAAPAWQGAVRRVEAELAALPDSYLQARAADIRAVGDLVLRSLLGLQAPTVSGEGVLVTGDLTPAEAASLDPARVAAVVLAYGSPTAHSAILARARGIPAVVAAGAGVLAWPPGTLVAVDGTSGELVVQPDDAVLKGFRERAARDAARDAAALARAGAPATTVDGIAILVGANVGSLEDAVAAAARGGDLAGLVRTEFLFLGRTDAPDMEEQEAAYRALAQALSGRRLTLRTLDVGGDKPLSYLPLPAEANPFLGVRGLRLSLARPKLLAEQLIAMMRVAHDVPVSVMFPMVSTVAELAAARSMVDDAIAAVGRGRPGGLQVGMMVEVPAAALKTAAFAPMVDFFSIGTNDLTQYTLAAERGNDSVAQLGDPFDPGVLRLVDAVCRGAGSALVAVCGELAADERATELLVGLGVRELSVAPQAIPQVKQAVRAVDGAEASKLAAAALDADGPDAVRALLVRHHPSTP